jgi:rod shape-determining protein MreC
MEFLLSRYRNLTVLLVVIAAQLLLIAYQVRTEKDIPLLRVWAVTAVTPIEQGLEFVRRNTWGFVEDYFVLLGTRRENERLNKAVGQLKLENQYLKNELSTADRARALAVFQEHAQSKTVAAVVIGNGTGANSKVVFVDRGSTSGIQDGMAVVTPDGIVGKVVAAYPTASLVLLITDANFAAGVISQKNRVHGTLKGQGHDGSVIVDYVQNEETVDSGEWFFTSGDDRIFPKGFPVGPATTVRNGASVKEIYVSPSGFQNGLEEVLIVLDAVHQDIPTTDMAGQRYKLIAPPPESEGTPAADPATGALTTDADRLREQYKQLGDAQHHTFGEGAPGSTPPDFTKLPGVREHAQGAPTPPGGQAQPNQPPGAAPPAQPGETASGPAAPPRADSARTPEGRTPPSSGSGTTSKENAAAPAKPRPPAPLLVTDPTDADPSDPETPPAEKPAPPKPKAPPAQP